MDAEEAPTPIEPRLGARPRSTPWWVVTTSPLWALVVSAIWAVLIIVTLVSGGPFSIWQTLMMCGFGVLIALNAASLFWMVRSGLLPPRR